MSFRRRCRSRLGIRETTLDGKSRLRSGSRRNSSPPWRVGRNRRQTRRTVADRLVATLAQVDVCGRDATERIVGNASQAFLRWRQTPAPRRGELVRRFGDELRKHKADLARLVTLEVGKISTESLGEVQEMIDICDFAVGVVAPTLRANDRIGARGPCVARTLASARRRRGHHGF